MTVNKQAASRSAWHFYRGWERESERVCTMSKGVSIREAKKALGAEGAKAGVGERLFPAMGSGTAAPAKGRDPRDRRAEGEL